MDRFVGLRFRRSKRYPSRGREVRSWNNEGNPRENTFADSRAIGSKSETTAMANAITTIDFDDAFESLVLHPTSPTFAAAHAASAVANASGRSLLTGYVAGIETAYRVGKSVYPGHYEHGWHITGTVDTFGAAAAAASILDLSADAVAHALGIAASTSARRAHPTTRSPRRDEKRSTSGSTRPASPGSNPPLGEGVPFTLAVLLVRPTTRPPFGTFRPVVRIPCGRRRHPRSRRRTRV